MEEIPKYQYFLYPLTKQGTQKKNPDTQFNEKWVGKNSPKYPIAKNLN